MPASVNTVLVDTSVAVTPVVAVDTTKIQLQKRYVAAPSVWPGAARTQDAGDCVAKRAHTFPATRFLGAGAAMSRCELAPAEIAGRPSECC